MEIEDEMSWYVSKILEEVSISDFQIQGRIGVLQGENGHRICEALGLHSVSILNGRKASFLSGQVFQEVNDDFTCQHLSRQLTQWFTQNKGNKELHYSRYSRGELRKGHFFCFSDDNSKTVYQRIYHRSLDFMAPKARFDFQIQAIQHKVVEVAEFKPEIEVKDDIKDFRFGFWTFSITHQLILDIRSKKIVSQHFFGRIHADGKLLKEKMKKDTRISLAASLIDTLRIISIAADTRRTITHK